MKYNYRPLVSILCAVAFIISACKKDGGSSSSSTSVPGPRIKTITSVGNYVDSFSYDEKGRVLRILYTKNGNYAGKDEFIYTDTSVIQKYSDSAGVRNIDLTNNLNAAGLRTKTIRSDVPDGLTLYTYGTSTQLTFSSIIQNAGSISEKHNDTYLFYSNGNLDSSKNVSSSGTQVIHYDEYFTDRPNTVGNENTGELFKGASSRNPVKKVRFPGYTSNYEYEYDSKNRIVKQRTYVGGALSDSTIFIYY